MKRRSVLLVSALVMLTAIVLRGFFFQAFRVADTTMEPGLLSGDFVIGLKPFSWTTPLKRGEYVALRSENGQVWISRVIGVEGDKLEYDGHRLLLNDGKEPVFEAEAAASRTGPFLVPLEHVFVLPEKGAREQARGIVPLNEVLARLRVIWLSVDPDEGIRWERWLRSI